jgi:hypothetical protein
MDLLKSLGRKSFANQTQEATVFQYLKGIRSMQHGTAALSPLQTTIPNFVGYDLALRKPP